MASERSAGREPGVVVSLVHTFVIALLPLVTVVTGNLGQYPINATVVARAAGVVVGGTVVALWLLRYVGWSVSARAAWLSVFILAVNTYYLVPVPPFFPRRVDGASAPFAICYLVVCAAVASGVVRPWQRKRRDPVPLLIIAGVILVMSLYAPLRAMLSAEATWEAAANALTRPEFERRDSPSPERDVYVIILDAFGRPDVLREYYDVDLGPFVASLEAKGFYVPSRGRSNYAQTFLAVPAMLNMEYIDGIAQAMGPESRDRRPLKHVIETNALMTLAKRAGYTVVGIASDYTATEDFPQADVCVCPLAIPHEFDYITLRHSPFAALGRFQWISAGRRRHVLNSFAEIERAAELPGRKFVVAHLITPHPPFVFHRDGQPRTPPGDMPMIDGEWLSRSVRARPEFDLEYVRGYAEQVDFVSRRLSTLTDRLLSGRGPTPAIMIVGDHGPGLDLDLYDLAATNMYERMSIFSAYHLPGQHERVLYPDISPVNGARAIADRYLGVHVPFLPERSEFSTFLRPYRLTPVPPEALEAGRTGWSVHADAVAREHLDVKPSDHVDK